MKTLKLTFAIILIAFISQGNLTGQVMHTDVVVKFIDYDYTSVAPFVGIVNGSYTYHYAIKLNKDGKIERIHWVIKDCNLYNQNGDKIIAVDTGQDNLGLIWEFFNKPNEGNGFPEGLVYCNEDGWLDDYMPDTFPFEGSFVNMSFKMLVKGQQWTYWAGMVQLHRNSKGVITAEVVKP